MDKLNTLRKGLKKGFINTAVTYGDSVVTLLNVAVTMYDTDVTVSHFFSVIVIIIKFVLLV